MQKFLYGEGRKLDEGLLAPLIVGKAVHLEGVHRTPPLEVRVAHPDEAVGVAGRLEYSPCRLKFPAVVEFVALSV